jgi:hypothetical protein
MLDRDACERRIYRLAALLTGHPITAARIIDQVLKSQPDLHRIDGARMDRLTLLRSREIAPALLVDELVPRDVAGVLCGMPTQQREAWVFSRVYQMPQREASRAMDCSVTATGRHLELADAAFAAGGVQSEVAADVMLKYSMGLDVPEFYRAAQRQRGRQRRLLWWSAIIVVVIAIIGLIVWWARFLEGQ